MAVKVYLHKKTIFCLMGAVAMMIYISVVPSCELFYSYIPSGEIIADIVPALSNSSLADQTPLCPIVPPHLDKVIEVNLAPVLTTMAEDRQILKGGAWRPTSCLPRHHVAIILPYRNRPVQLQIFLYHMHSFLQKQLLDYRIFVIEQGPRLPFNRAALFNVGYTESLKISDFHCFIFHDVDLLPINTANMYACSRNPRHMTVSINVLRFNLLYESMFGGATAITTKQFKVINGFSNSFFGWGGEDDDMANRIQNKGMKIGRWDPRISRYHMLHHAKEVPSGDRFVLLNEGKLKYDTDGLNTLKYRVITHEEKDLSTWIQVDFDNTDNG